MTRDETDFGSLVARIERITQFPMIILSVIYLAIFTIGLFPRIPDEIRGAAEFMDYTIIAVFAAELLLRVAVADHRLAYLRYHWLDVVIVVIPFLRPLQFLRLLRVLPMLARLVVALRQVMGPYRGSYVVTIGILSVLVSAGLMTIFESESDGNIQDFGDALWWAMATVTTVGYGDVAPITVEGRAVAVFLMVIGIALFGLTTASIAALLVESTRATSEPASDSGLSDRIAAMEQQVAEQNRLIGRLIEQSTPNSDE
ncbi:MAG: potassium channel family protein [Chloroflexi bacterium]|nr:potassium channel family protein [Chloroflexota bacterium]